MHTSFHKEIEKLRLKFLMLGGMVEDRVRKACATIDTLDEALARKIVRTDYEIDELEVEVEEECLKILALHQPVARDLRFLVTVIKVNNEIERIGDYAAKIAQRIICIVTEKSPRPAMDLHPMADKVITMLKMSLDALVNRDAAQAHRVFILDDEVDAMRNQIHELLRDEFGRDNNDPNCMFNTYLLARHLERIGDRATNIAEEVIYMVEGEIIRSLPH